jgi:hypothetical protein
MVVELLAAAGGDASVEGDVEGVECGLPAVGLPVGSRLQTVRYNTFNADCSLGKWPRALTERRNRALRDSMALVLHTMRRISWSNWRKGVNSAQALVHSRIIAGYLRSHLAENSANASSAACSDGAV